ncbi:MAG: CoA-binding protein [Saprospiraceae bacterium]
MENKKTVVLGASTNEERVSNQAVHRLVKAGLETVPVGIRKGAIAGIEILNGEPKIEDVHTVTLYLNPKRQGMYYDYILNDLKPKRIVFNPGTENWELMRKAQKEGIKTEIACTLVMLAVGNY